MTAAPLFLEPRPSHKTRATQLVFCIWIPPESKTKPALLRVNTGRSNGDCVFCWAAGGGIDVKMHRNIAIRAIDMTYILLRDHGYSSHNGRLSAGLVWRLSGNGS